MRSNHFLNILCLACAFLLLATGITSCESDSEGRLDECTDGYRECLDVNNIGRYRICENHKWSDYSACPGLLSCKDAQSCMPYTAVIDTREPVYQRCDADEETTCISGNLKVCMYGLWVFTPCESGVCLDAHKCAEKCEDGRVKCQEPPGSAYGMMTTCTGGVWVETDACDSTSCKSDTECGSCTNMVAGYTLGYPAVYCQRGIDKELSCPAGNVEGKFWLCAGKCDGSQADFCWERGKIDNTYYGDAYKCINGEWVKQDCNGPCNADSTDCAQ